LLKVKVGEQKGGEFTRKCGLQKSSLLEKV